MNPYQIIPLRHGAPQRLIRDRAIVDLLELRERHMAPGRVRTDKLAAMWHCSRHRAGRRLAAINDLPGWRVTWQLGPTAYARIEQCAVVDQPAQTLTPRERWERLREAARCG